MRKATNERREDFMRVLAMSALACTLVPGLSATAEARSLLDKLRITVLKISLFGKEQNEPAQPG